MAREDYIGESIEDLMRQAGVEGDDVEGEEIGGGKAKFRPRKASGNRYSGYLGFGARASVTTLAQNTFSDVVQRNYKPSRLVVVPSDTGFVVDAIKIGDEDLIVGSKSVAAEMFSVNAMLGPSDDMPAAAPGMTIAVRVTNTTGGTLTCAAAMRGDVVR
jgi:hypothetical protein